MDVIEEPLAPVRGLWKMGLFMAVWMVMVQGSIRLVFDGLRPDWGAYVPLAVGSVATGLIFPFVMARQYRPAHGAATVVDREAFLAKAGRRRGIWRPTIRATDDGFRLNGSNWLVELPDLVVRYDGATARLYGPSSLVRLLMKDADASRPRGDAST